MTVPPLAGDRPVELLLVLGALALAPVALVTLTSFLKAAVVLSLLRSALGAPQVPPGTAVAGLALLGAALAMPPGAGAGWGLPVCLATGEADARNGRLLPRGGGFSGRPPGVQRGQTGGLDQAQGKD